MSQEYTEWEIYTMRQRYYEIKNSINIYSNQIETNNKEINKINNRIDELTTIKNNFRRSSDKFDDYINTKKRKFEGLRFYKNTKFARDCSEEMLGFIKSRDTSRAKENIDNAINETQRKANKLSYDIDELKRNNIRLRNRISDLEYERRLILQKGVI